MEPNLKSNLPRPGSVIDPKPLDYQARPAPDANLQPSPRLAIPTFAFIAMASVLLVGYCIADAPANGVGWSLVLGSLLFGAAGCAVLAGSWSNRNKLRWLALLSVIVYWLAALASVALFLTRFFRATSWEVF